MGKSLSEIRYAMRISILEGSFATVFIMLTTGTAGTTAFLTGYALHLGVNDFQIGLIASLLFALQFVQVFSAYAIQKIGGRKKFVFFTALFAKSIISVLIFLPYFSFLSTNQKLLILFVVLIISHINGIMGGNAWISWVSELFPEKIRGRYFGIRTGIHSVINILSNLVGGLILDYFINHDQKTFGFSIIMSIASFFGIMSSLFFLKHPERKIEKTENQKFFLLLKEPLSNVYFKKILMFFFSWNLSVGISAAFFTVHMIRNLNMSFSQMALQQMVVASVSVFSARVWGKLIDRFGSKSVLLANGAVICLIPIPYLIATKTFLLPVFIEPFISGVCWTGFNLAAFTYPIDASPKENRGFYVAMFGIFTGIGFLIASLTGGFIAESLSGFKYELFGSVFVNFHILFLITILLRVISVYKLSSLKEPQEKGISLMFLFLGNAVSRITSFGAQLFPILTYSIPKRIATSVESMSTKIENISDDISSVMINLSEGITNKVDKISENVSQKVETVSNRFSMHIINYSNNVLEKIENMSKNILDSFSDLKKNNKNDKENKL